MALLGMALFTGTAAQAFNSQLNIGSGQYTIGIVGYVPVICRATVDATSVPTTPGQVSLGGLNEFCNSPNGYSVYADYSANLAKASLIVDGQKVPLSAGGSTRVTKSNRAAIDAHTLALDLPKGVAADSISFRIVAN
jgi:hypothetical protein